MAYARLLEMIQRDTPFRAMRAISMNKYKSITVSESNAELGLVTLYGADLNIREQQQ